MQNNLKTAIDLFSGCGGLTEGLKRAGFNVVGALELDHIAADTYQLNHPEVNLKRLDIRKLDSAFWMSELNMVSGQLDLLAGCPPCQGFSTLRTKNGAYSNEDDRNNLVLQMLGVIKHFRPKAVIMENVPGLEKQVVFDNFVKSLIALDYKPEWHVHNVKQYNVPQRRRRLVLVAGKGFSIPFPTASDQESTVRMAIGNLKTAGVSGDPLHDISEKRSERIKELIELVPKDGGSRTDLPKKYWLPCHLRSDGFKDVYGRMAWDSVSPTITGGCFNPSKGRFLHPTENRTITLREAALLQTFDMSFRVPPNLSKSAVAQMIGNAIPPEFVRMQASEIINAIDLNI